MMYGLLGKTLRHSYSPLIHKEFGNENYSLFEVEKDQLHKFLQEKNFKGINVTIPYKVEAMQYCEVSDIAKKIGAVNTIINQDGKLYGYNTDYYGLRYCIEEPKINLKDKIVTILGSGGTSKVAEKVATDGGAKEIIIVSRKGDLTYEETQRYSHCHVLINTTPLGMYPNEGLSPVDLEVFSYIEAVIDVIYNPRYTELLLSARKSKIKYAGGLNMLVAQAYYAHKMFNGQNITSLNDDDHSAIRNCIKKVEQSCYNIVFVGMPGVGKSSVGRTVAKSLGLHFVDIDVEIERSQGKRCQEIITQQGEDRFRYIEKEIITSISKKRGQVIATGGGSILKEENRKNLLQNGKIIFLKRDLNKLSIANRPLSTNLKSMYEIRLPMYKEIAHEEIECSNTLKETIEKVMKLL